MKKAWYVVRTLVGHENKVKASIEKRAEAKQMQDHIFRILIPTEQEVRNKGGKKQTITRKVFPGYVLVEMVMTDESWTLVRTTPGVTSFVSSGDEKKGIKPVPLNDQEVSDILESIESSKQRPRVTWQRGDIVRITDGPFADFSGKIEEVNSEKNKVKVLISIFGRDTPVELEFNQIEKVT
ncbi:MAG: transcription termination/antitermination factor NusG [Fimbriimonadia bacterium]|nr:transcription termination/antitermination factor NusG [Fimbriimonadia bacterium]